MAILLSPEQEEASYSIMEYLANNRTTPFTMHGLAGTGKTTVLADISKDVPHAILCTLTGKAASVLRRKTGVMASTIHSAFYQLEGIEEKKGKKDLIFRRAHDADELAGKIVLLDECSNINEFMARDIMRTGAKIVACGDPGQLPPVTGEKFFINPHVTLQTIHRQALESPIIRQAYRVRKDDPYRTDGDSFRVLKRGFDAEDLMKADIVLCYTNNTRAAINQHKRDIMGFIQPYPVAGEPVMCMKNSQEYGIFNGAIYTLEETFLPGDTTIRIDVDGVSKKIPFVRFHGVKNGLNDNDTVTTHFDFGYAMTIHKAQGSEWANVALIDEYRRSSERREWLYTAITRASESIVITPFPLGYQEPPPLPF